MQAKIYIDEAGNTGADIRENRQPFFVLAGVMLDSMREKKVFRTMDEKFIQCKEKEEIEIKGAKWVKSARKADALQKIIEEILLQEGSLAVVIIEKRYMAAAMVIDNFFDYCYNDIKDPRWVNDKTLKIKGANYFFERMDGNLAFKVWNIFLKKHSIEEYLEVIDELTGITDIEEYRRFLQGAKFHIPELIKDIFDYSTADGSLSGIPLNKMRAPNYTAFFTLINMMVPICKKYGRKAELIVDRQDQFEESYRKIFKAFSNMEMPFIRIGENPGDCIYSWRETVTDLSFADSKTEKGIQLADIVASSVNSLMAKSQDYKNNSFYKLDQMNILLLHILGERLNTVHYVVSKPFFEKYMEAVKEESKRIIRE